MQFARDNVQIKLIPRTPEQIASFYEGRGFPKAMIDVLRQQCFVGVIIHNKRSDILWLELANWSFSVNGNALERPPREVWLQRWAEMNMPMSSRATFRWTLLPETLDFLPDEHEGGNLILPRVSGDISVHASFATAEDKHGERIEFAFDKLQCAVDTQ